MRANIHLNPQMPFYPKDFLTHTAFLTDSQAIRYLWILCNMYIHGHLTEKQMISVCRGYDKEVFDMFDRDEDGNYYDEKLEYEIRKRDEYQSKATQRRGATRSIQVKNPKKPKEEKPRAEKRTYGSKGNVYLTDEEYGLLKEKFGDTTDDRIEALSLYMLSKNREYGSHYATIMGWEVNNEIRKKEEKNRTRDYSGFEKMAAEQESIRNKYLQK